MATCSAKGCRRRAIGVSVPYCDFHAYANEKGEEAAKRQLADTPAADTVRKQLAKAPR